MLDARAFQPHLILPTLLIAVSYFLCASLGQILAIPPGNITLIWPPSGIAFAAVLLMGARALPGVFLGAVLSNVVQSELSPAIAVLALLVGAGSSLQPLAGKFLYKVFGVAAAPVSSVYSAARFSAVVLLMTLVSSTIGTLAMSVTGLLGTGTAQTFLTWWFGDALGALVFTPIVLALFRQAFESHKGRFLGLTIVMAGMSVVIMTTAIVVHYGVYFDVQRARLSEQAVNQALYLDNLADAEKQRGVTRAETDLAIADHFRIWDGDAANGRMFVLGAYQGDTVHYVHKAGTNADLVPDLLPLTSQRGEPMRRALMGESGSMIGLDSAGREVLAAYQPVPGLQLGLVVQQEISSIRQPFIVSAAALIVIALVLILSGVYWVQRLSAPLVADLERKSEDLQQLVDQQTRELRASEQQFRSLLDSTPEAMVIIDAAGKMLLTNRKLSEISGYSAEELAGKSVDMLVPEAVRGRHGAHRDDYFVKPTSRKLDERVGLALQRKDGRQFPVAISLNPINAPQGLIIAASIRDVTEQKAYEAMLIDSRRDAEAARERIHASQQLMELIFNTSGNFIYAKDLDGKYIVANDYFLKHTGRTRDQIIGHDDIEIFGEKDGRAYMENDKQVIATRTFQRLDEAIGTRVNISYKYPLTDIHGKVTGVCGISTDITEQKELQEALKSAKQEAEAATEAKANFLASMSHEIRTPMNAVIGMVDLLRQTELNEEQREMLRTVSFSGQALLTIINDILDLSKIEAGKLALEHIPFSLLDTVEGSAKTVSINAQKKGLAVITSVDPALPAILQGDPVRLRQILINLIGNAIKFTEKGKIVVRVLQASRDTAGVRIRLEVKDEGIGISAEAQRNLFSDFTQAEASTTRKYGGTGLGLSICKRLTTAMGGTIGIVSELGKGATFHAELPLALVPNPGEPALADLHGVHVLLVSADAELTAVMQTTLQSRNARVSICHKLDEVLPVCAAQGVDVVVAGYDWPRGEQFNLGLEARRQGNKTTRFIAMVIGRRLKARIENEDTLTLDVVPLTDSGLVHAVAISVGRASPEVHHGDAEILEKPARVLSVDEARAAGTLVLVAEDNPTNRDVIGRQLRVLGHTCEMAEDGKQALEAWRTGKYAVLLTDCHMPVMDGFELTAAIRAEERIGQGAQRFPVVAITANALQGEAERCLAAGMDAYMSKPIDMKELRRMLKRFVPEMHSDTVAPNPAPAQAKAEGGAVDPSVLKGMFGDDMDTFREILREFVAPSRQIADEIRAAATSGSAPALKQAAHKLKSSARSIGANRLADLCLALEQAGAQGRLDSVSVTLQQFDDSIADVFRYIESLG